MRYQKLDNQETQWKWLYLTRKAREGVNITRYLEQSMAEDKIQQLTKLEHQTEAVKQWIENHMSPDLVVKLDQAIRAKRKRFFNAEKQTTKKKSIDLDYAVWHRLSRYSRKMKMTLSQTIMYMIDEQESKVLYESQIQAMKKNLKDLLK
ncbi:macrodomain Ter protein MatP [Gallibacterium trehalosifermentans]|uniref:Macrodomain Ter protein n=1 Tax=Gallibacterium trehalosifermentans TaxID=516935 RepID=A0ABV6GYT4_9PAST